MKTFVRKEKQSAPAARKTHPYVHHPMGPVQQAQQAEISHILRSTGMETKQSVFQRKEAKEVEEEEPLQGKFETVQRQTPEEDDEEKPLQGKFTTSGLTTQFQSNGDDAENRTGMPNQLKTGLEQLSGMDLSGVRVHKNSSKPARVNALAYTQGQDIHMGPGQEKHLPHEGWHAVQQMQGRVNPTTQTKGVSINDDAGLENEADVMGTKALQKIQASQNSSNAKVPGIYSSDSSPGDKYVREARRVQEPQGKQLTAHPLAHVVQNSGGEMVQCTPAAAAWTVSEWLGAAALGFAVANEAVKDTAGDISWKLDEAEKVLLPGGSKDIKKYQKENPKLQITQKELVVSFWRGYKDQKKAGITFGLTFSTDGKGIGDVSARIMPGGTHDWVGWGAKCSVNLMPISFVSKGGKAVIRVTLTNSWLFEVLGVETKSGVDSEVWHLEGDGTFKRQRNDKKMFVEHRLT